MRRFFALCTLFFFVCTFAAPRPAHAVVPLAVIGVAAVGASMLAAGTGAYYAQTGAVPSYVSATANAVASAADHMFYPAYLAKGAYNVVTAASFPAAQQFYLAKSAALGASMGDIWNAVKNGAAGSWSALRSLFEANTFDAVGDGSTMTEGVANLWDVNPKGYVFANGSSHYTVGPTGYWQFHTSNPGYVTPATADALITGTKVSISFTTISGENSYPTTGWIALGLRSGTLRLFMFVKNSYMPSEYGTLVYWYGACTSTNDPESFPPLPGEPDYAALKEALTNPSSDVSNDIKDVIKTLPPAVVTPAASVPGTVDTAEPSPTLTQAEVDQWFKENTADVARAAADAAAAAAAADPTNAALQAAAAQAAVDAARAAQDAARPADEDYFADAPSLDIPEIKEVDFSPVTGLAGEMTSIFPFGLIDSIRSAMVPFSATPQTPSFDIDLGFVRQTITFSSFDGVASFVRGLASFFFYCLTGLFCFRLYSRM